MKYRILLDRELCSGFGECAKLVPEAFGLEPDGRAVALVAATDDDAVRKAAAVCPMAAIQIVKIEAA